METVDRVTARALHSGFLEGVLQGFGLRVWVQGAGFGYRGSGFRGLGSDV